MLWTYGLVGAVNVLHVAESHEQPAAGLKFGRDSVFYFLASPGLGGGLSGSGVVYLFSVGSEGLRLRGHPRKNRLSISSWLMMKCVQSLSTMYNMHIPPALQS